MAHSRTTDKPVNDNMKSVWVALNGCDDTTTFEMLITEEQEKMLEAMVIASQMASQYGCMPTMSLHEKNPRGDDYEA